jgi:hypothetical protein
MIRVKVIDLPKEGLTARELEGIINRFLEEEKPREILQIEFNSEYGFLIVVYRKGFR